MCPLYPLQYILMYLILLWPLWLFTCVLAYELPKLSVQYEFENITVEMDKAKEVNFQINNLKENSISSINILSKDPDILKVERQIVFDDANYDMNYLNSSFNATGVWLGKTEVFIQAINQKNEKINITKTLPATVIRKDRVIDHIFTGSVITLVSILYINFGCALDWSYLKETIKKPIGPVIGFFGQFLIMPVLSFVLGRSLFPDSPALQLGMFFTGVSPAGGASNIWTYILGGNINLSIAMTTISTFAAFGMMPLWIFTLGRVIFNSSDSLKVPYMKIGQFAFALVVPLAIGYLIQKYAPNFCKIMVRILKPLASFLLLFIIIFAVVTNTYLFDLFSWRMVVAGLGLPWLGYLLGMVSAIILKQNAKDVLAISIETGIQNTGIAIFLLRITLQQPEADLTTVVPVAVAVMTPFPLMLLFFVKKCRARYNQKKTVLHIMENGRDLEDKQHVETLTANQ
ncbi:ileal sodium/bile acid cotransporter-like [Chrysoperla carnea]|uniref:ileal sodium/bile acid cotransporter-like n=1 Tax=Chrysoperla carnea TaxID=189513 RepID=UPI001D05E447|nr:ileal sodium/bile acid cotransporter-like [Chrysoperla carnea]